MEEGLKHKSAAHFRKALKLYESKLFPKALKTIDKVFAETPRHGESLALKALILSYMNREGEGLSLAKEAIRCNMRSGMCWHTLGLLHKAANALDEALKCFMQAANFDPSNSTILRDLSMLQVHLKDYAGYRKSRLRLLQENPNISTSWLGYAVAEHLSGNAGRALEVLESFWKSAGAKLKSVERSEIILYKAELMAKLQRQSEALRSLEESKGDVVDKAGYNDLVAELALQSGEVEMAKESLHAILADNCEDQRRFLQLEQAHHYQDEESRLAFYRDMSARYPNSRAVQRLPLNYASGDCFSALFNTYIKTRLRKGIPSLANDLKALYTDEAKRVAMGTLLAQHYESLKTSRKFADEEQQEPPNVLLWLLVLYSRHMYRTGESDTAVRLIDEALAHTPTIPDLYLLKAKLMKKRGQLEAAASLVNEGRMLDYHDRFLNNKAAKYFFRVNQVAQAQEVMSAFSRDGSEDLNCHDNQSMWYELECGEALLRLGEPVKAAIEFEWVQKNLEEIYEGQYDYHSYCVRRVTLRAYFKFLEFESGLYQAKAFARAVCGMLKCYLAETSSFPLDKVLKATKRALKFNPSHAELVDLAFQLSVQQGRYLLALRLLRQQGDHYPQRRAELLAAVAAATLPEPVRLSFSQAAGCLSERS